MNEQQLFNLLKTKMVPDLRRTDEYNSKDAYSDLNSTAFEFKCRTVHYDTLMIDKPKYDHLMKNKRVRYICSTPEGVFSWNLKRLPEPKWEQMPMRSSTWYHREVDEVIKTIGFLAIKDAKNLTDILLS